MIRPSNRLWLVCQRLTLQSSQLRSIATATKQPIQWRTMMVRTQMSHYIRDWPTCNSISVRTINTSKKDKDGHHGHVEVLDPDWINNKPPKGPETAKDFADVSSQKNWISYGFDEVDQKEDTHLMHAFFFAFVTVGCILFTYTLYYYPDISLNDWALREGFLELERREQLGLPLIDPNLIDPELIDLPLDEDLGPYQVYT